MRPFTKFILSLLLISCNPTPKGIGEQNQSRDTFHLSESAGAAFQKDTLQINGLTVIQNSREGKFISLTTILGDSIIRAKDYYFQIAYPDINEDGFKDIRVSVVSNMPNQSENYFYDEQAHTFRQIANSDLDIRKVKGTQLYFSYNSTGCSDQNWESRLSKIEDWQEIEIGNMSAKGCGNKDDGIYICKVTEDKSTLLDKLSIEAIKQGRTHKWSFIERYWTRNFNKFAP